MPSPMNRVIVVWSTPDAIADNTVHCITGYGGVRVYDRDKVDSRLVAPFGKDRDAATLPYFDNMAEAKAYMAANPRKCVQLNFVVAARYGLTQE